VSPVRGDGEAACSVTGFRIPTRRC
jgi:hypothetical protein